MKLLLWTGDSMQVFGIGRAVYLVVVYCFGSLVRGYTVSARAK